MTVAAGGGAPALANPYSRTLARIHHEAFGDVARGAARTLLAALGRAGHRTGTVVDLGCGSGILSRIVSDAGYDVLGIDLSPDMLEIAASHAPRARFVRGSALDTPIPKAVAVAAVGECLSYAFDERAGPAELARIAGDVYRALAPRGVFLFDVAAPGRAAGGPRERWTDRGEWTLCYRAEEDGASRTLVRTITAFLRRGDAYARTDERHVLHLYPADAVLAALHEAGFQSETLAGYDGFDLTPGWNAFLAVRPTD